MTTKADELLARFQPASEEELARYRHEIVAYAALDQEMRFNVQCGFLARVYALIDGHNAEVERLTRENAKLRHRLEVDREFVDDGSGQLVERPADLPESCDGISCRDATIKLQDEAIERLTREMDEACLQQAIANNLARGELQKREVAESAIAAGRKRCGELEETLEVIERRAVRFRVSADQQAWHCAECDETWDGPRRNPEGHAEECSIAKACAALAGKDAQVTDEKRMNQPDTASRSVGE